MDKFESLRAFTQVIQAGGFAAAARQMGLSRSAVNKLVLNLEDALQVQLLHRTTRRVTPTPTGLAFYDRCLTILTDLEEAERAVSQLHQEPKGQLRINGPMSFGTLHLAPTVAAFLQQYPEVQVELCLSDRFIDPLEEGFDLTVRIAPPVESPSLISHSLCTMPVWFCAAPDYGDRHPLPQHPSDLKHHPCLIYGTLSRHHSWTYLDPHSQEEHRVTLSGPLWSNNGEAIRAAAVAGVGIALLPQFIVATDLATGRLQRILPQYRGPDLTISLLYPVNRHLSAKVRLLVDFLHKHLSRQDSGGTSPSGNVPGAGIPRG